MVPGTKSRLPYYFDPRDDYAPPATSELDTGSELIREVAGARDSQGELFGGIECWQHPTVLLLQHPEIWPFHSAWAANVRREVTRTEFRTMSKRETQAWAAMNGAAHRRLMEETRRKSKEASARGH